MDKDQVAAALDDIGTLLEIQGENSFRCNAYHNGALAISNTSKAISPNWSRPVSSRTFPASAKRCATKSPPLSTPASLPFHDDLRKKTPPGLLEMLRVGGLGPKGQVLYDELGMDDIDKLKEACEDDKVATLKGFGGKTQQKILEGIEFLKKTAGRVRIDQADAVAALLVDALRDAPGVQRLEAVRQLAAARGNRCRISTFSSAPTIRNRSWTAS